MRLDEIKQREAKATRGPWEWKICNEMNNVYLYACHSGHLIVMDFVRWGFNQAAPRFRKFSECIMERADKLINRGYLIHPDAELISHAPEDIHWLLARIEEARDLIEAYKDCLANLGAHRSEQISCEKWLEEIGK